MVSQLSAPLVTALAVALESHRAALLLKQDNADILFNTAQVLTSCAEALTSDRKQLSESCVQEAAKDLIEALELFQRCLSLQEFQYTESQEQIATSQEKNMDQGESEQTEPSEDSFDPEAEQWAVVVEPVTKDSLVDTAIAQLEALAALCGMATPDNEQIIAWIDEYSTDLLRSKISAYIDGTNHQSEVALSKARFISALTEASYRLGRIDFQTYKNELTKIFNDIGDMSDRPEALCSQADALIAFNSALMETELPESTEKFKRSQSMRWQALSAALNCLTLITNLPQIQNLPRIHMGRGDVEMYRWRLGQAPWEYPLARNNSGLLLRNAATYYRGAAALAKRDAFTEQETEGLAKESFSIGLTGDTSKIEVLLASNRQELMDRAEEFVEDGLAPAGDIKAVFIKADPDEIVI